MSGVDVSERQTENQTHLCESCMNSVVQTFKHLQKQIAELKQQKLELQTEHEKQMQVLANTIAVLEKKLAALKHEQ